MAPGPPWAGGQERSPEPCSEGWHSITAGFEQQLLLPGHGKGTSPAQEGTGGGICRAEPWAARGNWVWGLEGCREDGAGQGMRDQPRREELGYPDFTLEGTKYNTECHRGAKIRACRLRNETSSPLVSLGEKNPSAGTGFSSLVHPHCLPFACGKGHRRFLHGKISFKGCSWSCSEGSAASRGGWKHHPGPCNNT